MQSLDPSQVFSVAEIYALPTNNAPPIVQTRHRFAPQHKELTFTVKQRSDCIIALANTVLQALSKYGVHPILDGGSLLGYVRTGGKRLLPWDDDMDFSVIYSDLDVFRGRNNTKKLTTIVSSLAQQGIDFFFKLEEACNVCGRAVDLASGYYIDFFVWGRGVGVSSRGAKWRGSVKGCWREEADAEGANLTQEYLYKQGDWHMYWWDNVIREDEVFPLHPVTGFEGIDAGLLYAPRDPLAYLQSEYGAGVEWYAHPQQFVLFTQPTVPCMWLLCVIYVAIVILDRGVEPASLWDALFALCLVGTAVSVSLPGEGLRSGFAASAVVAATIGVLLRTQCFGSRREVMVVDSRDRSRKYAVVSAALLVSSLWPFYPMLLLFYEQLAQEFRMISCRQDGEKATPGFGFFDRGGKRH